MVSLHLDCGWVILTDGSRAPGCPTCSASTSGEQNGPRCRQCGCVERTGEVLLLT